MTTTNYLKARLASTIAAEQALSAFRSFLLQAIESNLWWRAHRDLEGRGQRTEFWQQFQTRFPDVFAYLGSMTGGDCDQALLGLLEFGSEQTNELYVEGPLLFFKAAGLWQCADWDLLAAFLKSRFGAEGVAWIGDDPGFDYFDLLQP